jgi:predicted ester cyclase
MTVIAHVILRGVTVEQYDAVRAEANWLEELPAGGIAHITWWEGADCHNTDAWESEAHFAAFAEQRLRPAVAAVGLSVEPEVSFHPAHEVYLPSTRRLFAATAPAGANAAAEPRAVAERLLDILDNMRYEEFTEVVTEDVEQVNPMAELHGAAEWIEFARGWTTAVPDGRHTITGAVQERDRVAIEGTFRGTHSGPLQMAGGTVAGTGAALNFPFVAVGQLRGGRLARVTISFDVLTVMAQLGLLPQPASA